MEKPKTVWDYKPWWCQPWSILLTGISIMLASWFWFETVWVTVLVSVPILAWMGFFILVFPRLYLQSILEEENVL